MTGFSDGYLGSLEKYILSYNRRHSAQNKRAIGALAAYLSINDPAFAYNASFLQVKFAKFEEFCQRAKDRFQVLQKINEDNLLEGIQKHHNLEKLTLIDGIWKIQITNESTGSTCQLAEEFWQEQTSLESRPEKILYYLRWEKEFKRYCFVISGRQALDGFQADPSIYKEYAQGCNQLIEKLREVLNPHEKE